MRTLLVLSATDKDIGKQLEETCRLLGVQADITDGSEPINEAPDLAVVSDTVPGEPGMLLKMLSSSGVPAYLLTSRPGLATFNAVKTAGGRGIIPLQTAAEDLKLILHAISGVKVFKQQQNPARPVQPNTGSGLPGTPGLKPGAGQGLARGMSQQGVEPSGTAGPVLHQAAAAVPGRPSLITAPVDSRQHLGTRPAAVPVQAAASPMPAYGITSQIIVSYAFKGGVGKSTLASNLAVALASIPNPKLRVCLVDFDINAAGRMADILNVAPSTTMLDWVATKYKEDISNYLVDGPCGIKFLPAPRRAHDERAVTREVAENVLQTLSRRFDIVIVDTPYVLRDSTIIAFDMATRIFLLAILDRPTLRGVYDLSQTMDALRIDPAKIQLIVNMVPKRSSLRIEDFQEAIKYPLLASIPYDPAVQTAVNRCELPVLDRKAKQFTGGLNKVVASIVPSYQYTAEQDKGKKRWFSFFKRG